MSKLNTPRTPESAAEQSFEKTGPAKTLLSRIMKNKGMVLAVLIAISTTFGCKAGCSCGGCDVAGCSVDPGDLRFNSCGGDDEKDEDDPYR